MENATLFLLLKQMDTRRRNQFRQFVFAPFANKHLEVQRLCEAVLQGAPDFELDKTALYQTATGDSAFRETVFNNLMSDLLQLLYDFLVWEQLQEDTMLRQDLLLKKLIPEDIPKASHRQLRLMERHLSGSSLQNGQYHYTAAQFNRHHDQQLLLEGNRQYDERLQRQNDHLDLYFLIEKLRLACDMTSRNTVVQAGYQCTHLETVRQMYRQLTTFHPVAAIYHAALLMLEQAGERTHFEALIRLLQQHQSCLPADELQVLHSYALNYCVKRINFGEPEYYREVLNLYQSMLHNKLVFNHQGQITQWTYINIATAGMRLGELDWTAHFLQEYRPFLPPDIRDNVFQHNLASLYFAKGQYRETLSKLQEVAFTDAFYGLSAKMIQIKCYFELQETEAALSLLESARMFLRRNKRLSGYQIRSAQHFFQVAGKLLRFREGRRLRPVIEKEVAQIQAEIRALSPLANRDWCEEKAGGLMG